MDTFDATQILWEMETDIEETKEYSEFKFATDDLIAQVIGTRPELLDKGFRLSLQLLRTQVRKIYIQRGYGDKS